MIHGAWTMAHGRMIGRSHGRMVGWLEGVTVGRCEEGSEDRTTVS